MGLSIAKGLENSGLLSKKDMILAETNQHRRESLEEQGFVVTGESVDAVLKANLVMLVVKPWQIDSLLEQIAPHVTMDHVLVSCVTGAKSESIYAKLTNEPPLFRVMPNTGISIQESMSCISAFHASKEQRLVIEKLFKQLGQVLFVPEDQMAAATALAGCGIAFALRFIRAAIQGGVEIGFGAEEAKLMAAQIAKGAAELILKNDTHPEREIDKVTTPKGITITGLNEMEHAGFSSSIIKGILASYNKIGSNS